MTDKWIVTGGCGFLGSNLTASLLADGCDVVVLDALIRVGGQENLQWLRGCAAKPKSGRLSFVQVDVRSRSDVDDAFAKHADGVTTVAHLAGQVAMTTSVERPRYDFEVNVLGAINILEAVRTRLHEAVVLFSSTNKVYGDLADIACDETPTRWALRDLPQGIPETRTLDFHSPYGCSKGAADQYFLDYHRMYGVQSIVFRHSSMYGGRQFSTFDQGWVGWFCQEAIRQRAEAADGKSVVPFTISGDGKQVRDLLVVDDAVACYRMAAMNPKAIGQAFNIGGGFEHNLSLLELFALLQDKLGHTPTFTRLPMRASDQKVFIADIRRAQAVFGWEPKVGVSEGVRRILTWLQK